MIKYLLYNYNIYYSKKISLKKNAENSAFFPRMFFIISM